MYFLILRPLTHSPWEHSLSMWGKEWPEWWWRGPAFQGAVNHEEKELVLNGGGRYIDGLGIEKWAAKAVPLSLGSLLLWVNETDFSSRVVCCQCLASYDVKSGVMDDRSFCSCLCPQVIQTISAVDKDNPSQGHTFHYSLEVLNNPNFTIKNNLGKTTWL